MFDDYEIAVSPGTAAELKDHLLLLQAEQALASLEGLSENAAYASDLGDDLAAARRAYVAAAVTELATLRAEVAGPQLG